MTLGETAFYLHPVMPLYAIYALITGNGLFMAVSTFSILLHEATHALTAKLFGEPPASIELTPLGAIMHMGDCSHLSVPKRAGILLAGPVMTLALCWLALTLTRCGVLSLLIGRTVFLCNLSILVINLLPALPLDGGSLLGLLLEKLLPIRLVHKIMCMIGSIIGVGMILLNVVTSWRLGGWNLSLAIAGCCLLYSAVAATRSNTLAELHYFMERKIAFERKGALTIRWVAVPVTTPLRVLLRKLPSGKMGMFSGYELGSMKPHGWLSEHEVIQYYLDKPHANYSDVVKNFPNRLNSTQKSTI